tara:strand:+ start:30316 stop:31527 length:1212 start_codon:yes stop_codon:yes gene_type:complete
MAYFLGNILPTRCEAAAHEEAADPSFHVTENDAKSLSTVGLPVRIEHAPNLTIGEITQEWDDDTGRKWVVGRIDEDSIEGRFATKDILSETRLYPSLSLQHIYREYNDGRSDKTGLEVSICKVPRRHGCHIRSATKNLQYKTKDSTLRKMSTEAASAAPPPASAPVPEPVPDSEQKTDTPSHDDELLQAQKATVELARKLDQLEQQNKELQDKQAAAEKAKEEERERKNAADMDFVSKMTESVLAQVAKASPELAGKESQDAIDTLRNQYPQECRKVMEIACCASKRADEAEKKYEQALKDFEKQKWKEDYERAMQTHTNVHGDTSATHEVEVRASKRAKTANPYAANNTAVAPSSAYGEAANLESASQIRDAYKALRGRGSTIDAMRSVASIVSEQRSRGFR